MKESETIVASALTFQEDKEKEIWEFTLLRTSL